MISDTAKGDTKDQYPDTRHRHRQRRRVKGEIVAKTQEMAHSELISSAPEDLKE